MVEAILVGNPNTGKTTLFNTLARANEHVGNWHGVTVEERAKTYQHKGKTIKLVDLPGIYSTSPLSFEEDVAIKYLNSHKQNLVINICDASNLQRNLYLTLCLIEMGLDVVLAVNQIDKRAIRKVDYALLEKRLGVKIVVLNAGNSKDCQKLNDEIINGKRSKAHLPHITSQNIEDIAVERYRFIDKVMDECASVQERVYGQSKIDKFLLNRFLALPIFVSILALVFYLTFFSLGKFLSDALNFLLESFVESPMLSWIANMSGQNSWIYGLFSEAIFGGVGAILTFLPQVGLLFFFLSLLEDSGYLARVAFVFDDILSKVGLSGKSVYTLLMGFGCSTSAVLTARNMEDKNSKIKTALLTPYMSCSAKFPIYSVLGGTFFGASNIWLILGLYLLGVVVAIAISLIFEKTCLKSKSQSFILEFPPYRMIGAKRVAKNLRDNIKLFLSRVGTMIVAMNIIVWVLSNFSASFVYVGGGEGVSILQTLGQIFAPVFVPLGFGNWAIVASLIAGLVAKEVILSSIMMFNGASSFMTLGAVASFASAGSLAAFLCFCLLYVPCLATISVLTKEIGAKWTAIGMAVQFVVAYVVAFVVYNLWNAIDIFGFAKIILPLLAICAIALSIAFVAKKIKEKKLCPYNKNCNKKCNKKM